MIQIVRYVIFISSYSICDIYQSQICDIQQCISMYILGYQQCIRMYILGYQQCISMYILGYQQCISMYKVGCQYMTYDTYQQICDTYQQCISMYIYQNISIWHTIHIIRYVIAYQLQICDIYQQCISMYILGYQYMTYDIYQQCISMSIYQDISIWHMIHIIRYVIYISCVRRPDA